MSDFSELEIYSDFNCIWCYFDKPSIKKLNNEYEVKIRWRAFSLHPDIPKEGMIIKELFGNNFQLMNDNMQELEKKASSLGLPLVHRTTLSNSRLSQELAKWAETKGKLEEYQNAVYKAYFLDGLNIADQSVLLEIIEACNLPQNEALKVIKTGKFSRAVDMDWEKAEELGIMAAPTYIMNKTRLVGSQPYKKLEELMLINNVPKKSHLP